MNDILPTLDEFEKSITNSDKVRTLLLNSFQFGCNCLDESHELTESRTRDAVTILVHVWERFRDEIEGPLVDVIWFATSGAPNGDNKDLNALVEIISSLLKVPGRDSFQKDLLATLDPFILQKCGLLPDPKLLTKKISKLNTELYYKQQKYNLLQEESEGYTKLLTVLFGDLIDVTPTKLREYMGNFDLDPNRVLDILFDLLDDHDQKEQILILMKDFAVDKIPLLLSFKIRQHQQNFGPSLPPSILRTSTLLAKHKLLDLSTLVPSASAEVIASFAHYEELEKLRVSRLGRISLTSDSNHHSDAKFKECQRLLKESTQALESGSVLVQLLSLLLAKDDWKLASTLLPSREDWSRLCSILPNKIGTALCNHLEEQIAKQYKDLVQNPIFKSTEVSNDRTMELHNGADCIDFYADVEGFLESSLSALYAVGQSGCLSSHPNLYSKLCNLLRALLLKANVEKLTTAVYDTLKYALVPTLSLIPPDAAISEDLWSVLSLLPFSTRYELYRDWRSGGLELSGIGSKPLIQIQYEIKAGKAARYSLKRLSKDNVRDMGRQVSKETHSNPLVVFSTILSQIESYDNLIQMMVEAVRFVTPLSLDVLGYCILTRLSGVGGVNRNRLKDDGVNVSQWLQSLENFTGAFYRKCPDVECRGILFYLVDRLKDGNVLELGVLKALIKTVGGYSFADYSPAASLSSLQLEGRAGSVLLKRETFAFGIVEQIDFRASKGLQTVLQSKALGVNLLILLAQVRLQLLFDSGGTKSKPVKLVANLVDMCSAVMLILLEFITDSMETKSATVSDKRLEGLTAIENYAATLPSLEVLFDKYGLDTVSSWMLCRPIYRAILNGESNDHFKCHLGDRKHVVYRMVPEFVWTRISPALVDTFFSFSLYDIHFPESNYKAELTRLMDTENRLATKKRNFNPEIHGMEFTRDDEVAWERVKASASSLSLDMDAQKKHCDAIRKHLSESNTSLFPYQDISVSAMQTFIAFCVFPRCRLNPDEAYYCVRFVMTLHSLKTPGFSVLLFIEEFIKVLTGALYSSTEDEAASMGILLLELWKVVSRWRYEAGTFDDDVAGTPGAVIVGSEGSISVSFCGYIELYNKWHAAIGRAMIACFDSTEYMHLRSCFVILSRIVDAFPTRPKLGQRLLDSLDLLQDETYPLQDIKTAAQAYGTLLIKARSDGVWKEEDIATVRAREEKEKAENEARQKRREQLLAELERDIEKQEADGGRKDKRDINRRRGHAVDSKIDGRRPIFEPPMKHQPPTGVPLSRRDVANENGDRGRLGVSDNNDRPGNRIERGGNRESHADRSLPQDTLDGRWERGQGGQSNFGKRDRSPGPDADDHLGSKRGRPENQHGTSGVLNFEPPPRPNPRVALSQQQRNMSDRGGYPRRGPVRK